MFGTDCYAFVPFLTDMNNDAKGIVWSSVTNNALFPHQFLIQGIVALSIIAGIFVYPILPCSVLGAADIMISLMPAVCDCFIAVPLLLFCIVNSGHHLQRRHADGSTYTVKGLDGLFLFAPVAVPGILLGLYSMFGTTVGNVRDNCSIAVTLVYVTNRFLAAGSLVGHSVALLVQSIHWHRQFANRPSRVNATIQTIELV